MNELEPIIAVKVCTKCGCEHPATPEFWNRHKRSPDGLRPDCKVCRGKYRLEHYSANRDRILALAAVRHIATYVAHPRPQLYDLESGTRTCSLCNEVLPATVEYFHRQGERSPDGLKPACKACANAALQERRAADPAAYLARRTIHRHAHLEEHNASCRAWRAANLEKSRVLDVVYTSRRRAQKKNSGGTHTAEDIKGQYDRQKGKCYYCGKKVGKKYHTDHVIPLAKGGSDGPENLVIACPSCNCSKGAKHPQDFCGRLL